MYGVCCLNGCGYFDMAYRFDAKIKQRHNNNYLSSVLPLLLEYYIHIYCSLYIIDIITNKIPLLNTCTYVTSQTLC